jgi:Caspase domain
LESRGLDRIDAASDSNSGDEAAAGRIQAVKRTLSLEPGDNRIEVVAYNAKGLIASEPAQMTVKWDGSKVATPPKLYVLAVGVNDYYDSRLRLAYAVPDATALADGFKRAGAGLYAGVEVKTVLDSEVTLANLDKVFAELSTKVQPRDVFVFFLAGHGKTKNGRYYFLPRDFRYEDDSSIEKAGMGQDKFQAWFAAIPARKSLLLYDTCESGSLTGANARGSDIDERLGALNRMARATGRAFLTATTDDAPALEGYRGHGVFTYTLLDALDHADINKNGLIEVSELADYVDLKVPDISYETFKLRQIPQRSVVGSNFALTNKVEVLAASAATAPSGKPAANAIQTPPVTASGKPTHVVLAPVDVFERLAGQGVKIEQLPAGTLLSLVKTEGGWALVARDGEQLGYVSEDRLMRVQ